MSQKLTSFVKLIILLVLLSSYNSLFGRFSNNVTSLTVWDTIISDPISVDTLYIIPSNPHEGDIISLVAATTHSSSPCGLIDYQVLMSSNNTIYVNARYWEGMLTAICYSVDTMKLGPLKEGKYVLNFINMKKIEFNVYPDEHCIADYSYVYPKCDGLVKCINTVEFTDNSSGNIYSWKWDFGDSTLSEQQNPVHTYKNPGIYNVCLTVACGQLQKNTDTECKLVPAPSSNCKADFDYKVINLPVDSVLTTELVAYPSFVVKFFDKSAGNIIKWEWDFGDGTFSNEQNPVHRYNEGVYVITLKIVTREGCESKYSEQITLTDPQPVCKYTGTVKDYSGLDGCKYIIELDNGIKLEPVIVSPDFVFHDNQRVILAYRPLHVPSICMVGITAEITCIREIVTPVCKSYFYYTKDTLADCMCYNFYDKSIGNVIEWNWDFGDGTISEEQNPKHVFDLYPGTVFYNVCLTIKTADGCEDTWCEKIVVRTEVPWVPVIGGDENHTIVVSKKLKTNIDIEIGDYLGLFFRDFLGNLVCGGMMRWEGNYGILTAWGNNCDDVLTNTPIPCKNGFNDKEKFEFKIWKWRTNEEFLVKRAGYAINNMFPDSGYYTDDGLSLLTSLCTYNSQVIPLHAGWNMTSLYVEPVSINMKDMFGDRNVIVKNYKGEIIYAPVIGIYDGIWNKYEGYKIKTLENTWLKVTGTRIDPQTVIPLPGNTIPYFLPYYYPRPYPIKLMMHHIDENIRYVQTFKYIGGVLNALNYIPKYNIDQIKYMEPGYAYKLSLYTAMRSFTYPPVDLITDTIVNENTNLLKSITGFHENNKILVIQEVVLPIKAGATVTAYTLDNILLGEEISEGGNMAISLWDTDLSADYDEFLLVVEEENNTSTYQISFSQNTISDGDMYILKGIPNNIVDKGSEKLKIYPTIVNNEFYIDLYNQKSSTVEIYIYDLLGKTVKRSELKNLSTGLNHLTINVGELGIGQYIYLIKTNKLVLRGMMQVRK